MNKTPFDDATLKQILDIGANLLFGELTKAPTAKHRQHRCTVTILLDGDEVELNAPKDDGQGPWELASWRPEPTNRIWAHWTRVVVQTEPRIGDLDEPGETGSKPPPWAPGDATGEAASSSSQ